MFVKNVPCTAADLTETGYEGRDSYCNVFVIGQISVQNHPKIFSGVFRSEFSSHKAEVRSDQYNLECSCPLPNTITFVLLGFDNERLLEHH